MATLPQFQSNNQPFQLMQNKWGSILNPIIANPLNNTLLLKDITLVSGTNVINHLLGRPMQGWYITDVNAAATIYRSQPFNNLTLTLTSSGPATINLAVF